MKKFVRCILILSLCLISFYTLCQYTPDTILITSYNIRGVEITAENKVGYHIMKKVYENRDKNNYERFPAYTYEVNDKIYVENIGDELKLAGKEAYFFMMESMSHGISYPPNKKQETVHAMKISGLSDPMLDIIIAQMFVSSIYNDFITIMGREYLSPINKNSIYGTKPQYVFRLVDTIVSSMQDSLLIVSFTPNENKNYKGISGFMHIKPTNWQVKYIEGKVGIGGDMGLSTKGDTVVFNPNKKTVFELSFTQNFDKLSDSLLFPYHLNMSLNLDLNMVIDSAKTISPVIQLNRQYANINFDKNISSKDISNIEYEIDANAFYRDNNYWQKYRITPLDDIANNTYSILDSIGGRENFDTKVQFIYSMMFMKLPIWKFNLLLNKILSYNYYSGLNIGLGIETNKRLSNFFTIGGNIGLGIKSKKLQWGVYSDFIFNRRKDWCLHLAICDELPEAGASYLDNFTSGSSLLDPLQYRNLLINRTDFVRTMNINSSVRLLKHFKLKSGLRLEHKIPQYEYKYTISDSNGTIKLIDNFHYAIVDFIVDFAYNEKFINTRYGLMSLGTKAPIISLHYERGIKGFYKGTFNYNKIEARVNGSVATIIGDFGFTLRGGYIDANIPYTNLFNGLSSFYRFTIFAPESFSTMRMNEFVADRYLATFLNFNFKAIYQSKNKKFAPAPALIFNCGIGDLRREAYALHQDIDIKTYNKGYYEAGININGLIDNPLYSSGFGVFYRFGPYSFDKVASNFAYKFTFQMKF